MKISIKNNLHIAIILIAVFTLFGICLLSSCSKVSADNEDEKSPPPTAEAKDAPVSPDVTPVSESPTPVSPSPSPEVTEPDVPEVIEPPAPVLPKYDFGSPVAESARVEDDYFSDAVFIGDSRTDGFRLYSGLNTPKYLSSKSISVINVGTAKVIPAGGDACVPILTALSWDSYGKVYIMLGINEIGISPSSYELYYSELIATVREMQPDAVLYLQAIMPVSEIKDSENSIYNNKNIVRFNEVIAKLAIQNNAYYIDTYSALANENGFLPADASYDGVHLTGTYCKAWCEYLRTHTVDPTLYSEPVPYDENAPVDEPVVSPDVPADVPADVSPDVPADVPVEGTPQDGTPAGTEPEVSSASGPITPGAANEYKL